jgi:hypothetical protein
MRTIVIAVAILGMINSAAVAQEAKTTLDRQIAESLREVHDRGADLYNAGDMAAGYRMYQGGLVMARGLLGHRSDVQKLITDGLVAAERQPAIGRRAFLLHELIEQVRGELRTATKKGPESLNVPPREVKPGGKPETKTGIKPAAGVDEVREGVIGRVLWEGKPIAGVDVTFVTLGQPLPRVYESSTGPQGVYAMTDVRPGKYIVLIVPGRNAEIRKLPDRYATTTTSPLRIDVKGGGEKLDFVLQ